MGVSTFLVGLLPTYDQIGWVAPVDPDRCCACCRAWRSAASTAARRSTWPSTRRVGRRGFYTAWIQTTATVGLLLSLIVILALRLYMGEAGFQRGEGYPDRRLAHPVPALDRPARASRSGSACR